jgi:hypothetical protein
VKKTLQQQHLRRLYLEPIVLEAGRKSTGTINQKPLTGRKKPTKKEEEFSRWKSEEYHHKKTEFQTAAFPPLSFRP